MATKPRAARNRTIELSSQETERMREQLLFDVLSSSGLIDQTICADSFEILPKLEPHKFDLLFSDPPYNLSKRFGREKFRQTTDEAYEEF
ncbi:MAG: site-specific DNA-methyltransferase, partial [Pyrinomonadaceae bacterium]